MIVQHVWVIAQHGVPLVVITGEIEATREHEYLAFHGDGYTCTKTPIESTAGRYAEVAGD